MGLGLVLSGGGGKGSYQIGVWKAFIELGIDKLITAVSGTSIGALNTALFINKNYSLAENIWHNISSNKILKFNGNYLMLDDKELIVTNEDLEYLMEKLNSNNMLASQHVSMWPHILKGIFSREGLVDIIDSNLNLENISTSEILGFATCTLMPWIKPKYFLLNNQDNESLKSILLASSAFPIAFGFEKINNQSYVDGGITDNVPIEPLYIQGYKDIIIVYLSPNDKINKSKYSNLNIIEIIPSNDLGNLITGTFDFSQKHAIARIEQGYKDTINMKEQLIL